MKDSNRSYIVGVVLIALAGLALRLLVWDWHALYPLGGDEREYLDRALTLLQERRYVELQFMRPPLYTLFLAAVIYMSDSQIQILRLAQALIGALTVLPIAALTRRLFGVRAALIAALITAFNFTLAVAATELLSETLFLFGLTVWAWMMTYTVDMPADAAPAARAAPGDGAPAARAAPGDGVETQYIASLRRAAGIWVIAAAAGAVLGLLVLVRTVALPLLPLGALFLAWHWRRRALVPVLVLFLGCALVVAPWTVRNYLTYNALILVDTTGTENLWLDNDPAGREAVKRQLYALGDDMDARQRLASERGMQAILADPGRFAAKAWGEAQKFFALQFFDDLRERRAIWVPPEEVWLRLLLGDGMWLLLLFAGTAGLWLGRPSVPCWTLLLAAPWVLYIVLTCLIFHVELRYRLPVYPLLIPFAAAFLAQRPPASPRRSALRIAALLSCLAAAAVMLMHRPYAHEAWELAWKHARLAQAQYDLGNGDVQQAWRAAQAALQYDPDSALARMLLAQAALLQNNRIVALEELDAALRAVPDHPQAHVLRGAVLRALGRIDPARADLAYETASLQDLQQWAWGVVPLVEPPQQGVNIGNGLDLGFIRGFHTAEPEDFRWTTARAEVLLLIPPDARWLWLRLKTDRPDGGPPTHVRVLIGDRELGVIQPGFDWQTIRIELPPEPGVAGGRTVIMLLSDTYRPRASNRANPDNRELGVMLDSISVTP